MLMLVVGACATPDDEANDPSVEQSSEQVDEAEQQEDQVEQQQPEQQQPQAPMRPGREDLDALTEGLKAELRDVDIFDVDEEDAPSVGVMQFETESAQLAPGAESIRQRLETVLVNDTPASVVEVRESSREEFKREIESAQEAGTPGAPEPGQAVEPEFVVEGAMFREEVEDDQARFRVEVELVRLEDDEVVFETREELVR